MKKIAENRMSMFYAVEGVCDAHAGVWAALVPYATAVSEVKANIGLLEDAIEVQEVELKGYAKDKAEKKEAMVDLTLDVAQAGYALAVDISDAVLQGKMDFSRSDLLAGRPRRQRVADRARRSLPRGDPLGSAARLAAA